MNIREFWNRLKDERGDWGIGYGVRPTSGGIVNDPSYQNLIKNIRQGITPPLANNISTMFSSTWKPSKSPNDYTKVSGNFGSGLDFSLIDGTGDDLSLIDGTGDDLSLIEKSISEGVDRATRDIKTQNDLRNYEISEDPHTITHESGGHEYALPSYAPIPTPEFPGELDAETIARLGEEAKNYANLAFAPGFEQLDQNLVNAERRAIEEEEAVKPVYWQSMRDAIGMGATAAVRALQGANQLGRLRGGQPGELYAGLEQSGLDQASGLEYQLGERVSDIYQNKTEVEEDIDRARVGMKKEQGLTEAVQKAQLMREELEREIGLIQMTFENRLASSADARDWQNANVAYMQFKQNAEQALWERGITERQLAAELQSQKLSNQLTLSKLNSSEAISPYDRERLDIEWAKLGLQNQDQEDDYKALLENMMYEDMYKDYQIDRSKLSSNPLRSWQLGTLGID
jgi:hypothetical protein